MATTRPFICPGCKEPMQVKAVVPAAVSAIIKADLDRVTYRCDTCEVEIERLEQRAAKP